jgi:hypothetical protein
MARSAAVIVRRPEVKIVPCSNVSILAKVGIVTAMVKIERNCIISDDRVGISPPVLDGFGEFLS